MDQYQIGTDLLGRVSERGTFGIFKMDLLRRWTLPAIVGVLFLIVSYPYARDWLAGPEYHRIVSMTLNKKVYRPGETIESTLVIDRQMPADCMITANRFIERANDNTVVWSQMAPGLAGNGPNQKILRTINPPPLPPGKYVLFAYVTNECKNGNYRAEAPRAQFDIEK